ncbi:MAG: hypothetical protein H6568_04620 [Lewinellaceae bacterium]|nr:hypothetical protein [Saprospiraceae bacterium]MCB9312027.1 hypothetical protein [Lewinellaceae bacterium]HRW75518.1 hypothetical protein [Saprospiraceae bacterium]
MKTDFLQEGHLHHDPAAPVLPWESNSFESFYCFSSREEFFFISAKQCGNLRFNLVKMITLDQTKITGHDVFGRPLFGDDLSQVVGFLWDTLQANKLGCQYKESQLNYQISSIGVYFFIPSRSKT